LLIGDIPDGFDDIIDAKTELILEVDNMNITKN
jgi:hypothetical protein